MPEGACRCKSEDWDDATVSVDIGLIAGQGFNEYPSGTLRSFIRPQSHLDRVREVQVGNRRRTAARAETTGCARASRHVFDWQPRGRLRLAVLCPALRRCALATRLPQWSFQRSSFSIIQQKVGTVKWRSAAYLTARTAVSITRATASGWEM